MSVQVEKSNSHCSLAEAEEKLAKSQPIVKAKKPKKLKCKECNKKLISGLEHKCRCSKIFCIKCRLPEEHKCDFDYKTLGKEILTKANPVVMDDKIEKIS